MTYKILEATNHEDIEIEINTFCSIMPYKLSKLILTPINNSNDGVIYTAVLEQK